MKLTALIRTFLILVGLFSSTTKAQTTTLAIQQSQPYNSSPKKSSSNTTAKEKLVLSRPAEMNDPAVEITLAHLHEQLAAQLSYLQAVIAANKRRDPARAAMEEFLEDMRRSDYLAWRMMELGEESTFTYWKAVYGGGVDDALS